MSSYVVSYDLNNPKKDYSELFKRIRSYISSYHCLDKTWIINTEFNQKYIQSHLREAMAPEDKLFVAKLEQKLEQNGSRAA